MILTGAGQIGMAIARRMGYGMKIVVGDKRMENAQSMADTMNRAGFDVLPVEMDLSSRESILHLIDTAQQYGEIAMLVNAAGVSPSQASIETILKVDLYGTAVLLEEVGKVIMWGGTGVTISSQSGHRLPALGAETDELLACTPTERLLDLEVLQPQHINDTLHAYQLAKRCNVKRVMSEAVNGVEEERALILFLRASLLPHWLLMSLTVYVENFIRRCLPNVRHIVREQQMKWQMLPNC